MANPLLVLVVVLVVVVEPSRRHCRPGLVPEDSDWPERSESATPNDDRPRGESPGPESPLSPAWDFRRQPPF
ncbi:MAG: hypothetical protein FJ290_19985 [Planctomycetes bacterium]|nr:hypothetical protein [Planctomycetota bacterium]